MNYKLVIIISIVFLIIYFLFLAYDEKEQNYNKDYIKTVAKIIDKKIESEDSIEKVKNTNQFKHKKKFRIKIKYIYNANNKEYIGQYYNDGNINNNKFLNEEEYIPIGNTYKYLKFINIYYNKEKPYDSCLKLDEIKNRKKKIFYILIVGLFFTIPFIIYI